MARRKLFDTGEVTTSHDGWLVLNPESTFPLGVHGVDLKVAAKIKRGLEKGYSLGRDAEEVVFPIISRSRSFRWREIEIFQRDFTTPFVAALSEMQQQLPEWAAFNAAGDEAEERRDRLSAQMHKSLVEAWGEAFRNAAAVVSDDRHERVSATTELLVLTYVAAGHATEDKKQHLDPDLLVSVLGWTLERPPRGCCHICRSWPDEYARQHHPNVPIHAGCMCRISPKLRSLR
jgi:hypothetical protein